MPLLNSEDLSLQMTMTYDAFAEDKDYIYNYNEFRGMTRATKSRTESWKEVDVLNADCKGLKCVSMVIHDGKLLVRHASLKDEPFVEFDKATMKPVEPTEETKFKHPEGDDDDAKRSKLDWSDVKLAKEEDEELEKQTEEQKAEEEKRRARRRIGATPLASDGTHIYALSAQVKQDEDDMPVLNEKFSVEVFEIAEGNVVKRTKTFVLKTDDSTDWDVKHAKYPTDGGFLNHVQIACNGRVFILNMPQSTLFFKVEDGIKFADSKKRETLTRFQLAYNCDNNTFSGFKTDVF